MGYRGISSRLASRRLLRKRLVETLPISSVKYGFSEPDFRGIFRALRALVGGLYWGWYWLLAAYRTREKWFARCAPLFVSQYRSSVARFPPQWLTSMSRSSRVAWVRGFVNS